MNKTQDPKPGRLDAVVNRRWHVRTGRNRITVDARTAQEAMEEAIERVVSDQSLPRSLGRLTMASLHGFDSEADDDVFASTESLMEGIGFRRDSEGGLRRCGTCKGVGRVDCCDDLECLDCGGLGTCDCPDCESL